MRRLLYELHRRKVLRVAGLYFAIGWALVQAAEWLQRALKISETFDDFVFAVLAIAFVPVLVFTWMFEITFDGVKRTAPAPEGFSTKPETVDWALAGVLVVVLAVMGAQSLWPPSREAPDTPANTVVTGEAKAAKVLCILPFATRSAKEQDEALGEELAEQIRSLMGALQVHGISARSSTSCFSFKGRALPIPEIAKKVGATHIVEGNIRRAAKELSISVRLIDANDSQVWADIFEVAFDVNDIFTVLDQIATSIAEALGVQFAYAAEPATQNTKAYRLFVDARREFRKRGKGNVDLAIDKFKAAVALDSKFAEAHAGLAAAYYSKASRLNSGFAKYWARAEPSAETALALKPNLAEAHAVLGSLARAQLKWEAAFVNGAKAVELDPNDSNSRLWLGMTQFSAGMLERAQATLEEAERDDPVYSFIRLWRARIAFSRGDDKTGERLARQLIATMADYRGFGHWYLAYLAKARGDLDEAEKQYRSAVGVWGTGTTLADGVIQAMRSPGAHAATVAALMAEMERDPAFAPETELLLIGERAAFVDSLKARLARGDTDGFRYFQTFLWRDPVGADGGASFRELARMAGLVDYWKKHGWPDKCRPAEGEDFICE